MSNGGEPRPPRGGGGGGGGPRGGGGGGGPRGGTPQQMQAMPSGYPQHGAYPMQYGGQYMQAPYGRQMQGQPPYAGGGMPPRGFAPQAYGGGAFQHAPQGQVWTPPGQTAASTTGSPKAAKALLPKKKRAGLQIINPDTKEAIKVVPKKEPEPKAEGADGADKKDGKADKTVDAKKSAPATPKGASATAVAEMTPNSRRKHALLITNPTDGSVVNDEKVLAKEAEKVKTSEPVAAKKSGFAAMAAKPKAPVMAPAPAPVSAPAPTPTPVPAAKPGFAAAAAKPAQPVQAKPTAAAVAAGTAAAPPQPTKGSVDAAKPAVVVPPVYVAGQWSPATPDGAKVYTKEFMNNRRVACAQSPAPACLDMTIDIQPVHRQASGGSNQGRKSGSDSFAAGFMGGGGGQRSRGAGPQRVPSGGPRANAPVGRASGGRRSIALPAREAPTLNKSENRYVPSALKGGAKADKSMLDEARMALNKLTLEKFDKLSVHLLELGIKDIEQLPAFTSMIFQKAVDEPFFCVVYSKLCKALHDMALERKATLTKPGSEEIIPLATHFKSLLLNNCQQQFEKAEKDALREREREVEARRVASDPVELEKISKMPRTEREKHELGLREEKRESIIRVAKVRRHIIGNITFIGELFLVDMVTEPIMRFCIEKLLVSAQSEHETKEYKEESLEQLCKLLETAGGKLERKYRKKAKGKGADVSTKWEDYFKQMASIASSGVTSRIKFAIQDVIDMRKANWESRNTKKGPKTIEEIHQEAKHELQMAAIATERHQRSGGGGRGGQGSRGRPPMAQPPRSRDNWVEIQRKNAKVDNNMFASLAPAAGKPAAFQLGGKRKLGKPGAAKASGGASGAVQGGRYVKNQFSLLADTSAKSPAKAEAPVAAPIDAEPNFSPEVMDKKINGSLNEYFSIKLIDEVKQSLDEWGRVTAVYTAFCTAALRKLEGLKIAERTALMGLFKQLIGADRGVPVGPFLASLAEFFEELPDIVCDAPKLPDYVGELIAAAIMGSSAALAAMNLLSTKPIQDVLFGDLPLKIALAAYNAIKASENETKAVALYTESAVPLSMLLPGDEDRVKDLADRANLLCLLNPPAAAAAADASGGVGDVVEKMVLDGATYDAVLAVVQKAVTAETKADGSAGSELTRAIISAVTAKSTLAAGTSVKEPTKEDEAKEAELLDTYKDVLRIVADTAKGQLAAVVAVAEFAAEKNFPKGMVNRLFEYLYDKDVVEEEVYLRFKTDKDLEKAMPKKTIAVQQAANFYDRLAQPDEP